MTKNRRSN